MASFSPEMLMRSALRVTAGAVVRARRAQVDEAWKIAEIVALRPKDPTPLGVEDYKFAAAKLRVDPQAIHAVADVESSKGGFDESGRLIIAYEPHVFSRATAHAFDKDHPAVSYPKWVRYKRGGPLPAGWSKHPLELSNLERWLLWRDAAALHFEAACAAISVGRFQVLAENAALLDFDSPSALIRHAAIGELAQLDLFCRFLVAKNLLPALRQMDWLKIELRYNGGGHGGAYADKMADAFRRRRQHYI